MQIDIMKYLTNFCKYFVNFNLLSLLLPNFYSFTKPPSKSSIQHVFLSSKITLNESLIFFPNLHKILAEISGWPRLPGGQPHPPDQSLAGSVHRPRPLQSAPVTGTRDILSLKHNIHFMHLNQNRITNIALLGSRGFRFPPWKDNHCQLQPGHCAGAEEEKTHEICSEYKGQVNYI